MNNNELEEVKYCKYLGVILDCKISWIQHIAYVKSKISKGVGIMYQARKYLDRRSLVNIYNSFISIFKFRRGAVLAGEEKNKNSINCH